MRTTTLPTAPPGAPTAEGDGDPFVLPAKMLWLYAVGPLLTAPIVIPNFLTFPLHMKLSTFASFYVAFFGLGAVLHLFYARLQPRRLQHEFRLGLLLVAHALFAAGVIIPAALLLQPLYCIVGYGSAAATKINYCLYHITPVQRFEFLWTSLVIAWSCVLPAAMLHGLRRERDAAERRMQEERRSRLAAQFQALQARVNPHFLFNSLNTIACLISEDPTAAERVVERLAELLRYCLQDPNQRVVRLGDELAVVRAYLEVQAARFGSRLRFSIECPPMLEGAGVPPLCLQPLVENAVLHGAVAERRGGVVAVRAEATADGLCLSVQDDGPGQGASLHRGNGIALRELRERLRILYPDASPPASLELLAVPAGIGCLVQLRLPLATVPPPRTGAPSEPGAQA